MTEVGQGSGKVVMTPLPEDADPIPREDWTLFKELPHFSFRNGDPTDAQSLLLKASIGKAWHWVPISGLAPEEGKNAVDAFIKSHLVHLNANRPANATNEQVRKAAIMLGTARAVSTSFYDIAENDLIPGEKADPLLKVHKSEEGELDYVPVGSLDAATKDALKTKLELTDTEKAVVCSLVRCSAGIIPMQGYSLIMNQHHYLSQADSQSRKVFQVPERAFWKSAQVNDWFETDKAMNQDVLWHKACHPVKIPIKEGCAMDPNIKDMLVAAGAGACASRLPAEESELRMASSYLTLMATVNPMFLMCKGEIDCGDLQFVTDLVRSLPVNVMNPVLPPRMPAALKTTITNRTTGIRYLGEMLRRNQDAVAYCYGWYFAMSEASMTMGGGGSMGTDTLKGSWSLSKLRSQSYASYVGGFQAYGDFHAVRAKLRADGVFVAPKFTIG